MNRRFVLLGVPALSLAACGGLPRAAPRRGVVASGLSVPPRTVLLVTPPAEREGAALGPAGEARAQALIEAASEFRLSAIYTPSTQPSVETVVPLSQARGLQIEPVPLRGAGDDVLRGAGGRQALWVSEPRGILDLWRALSLPEPQPSAAGDLAILRADGQGVVTIETRRYGA